MEDAASESSSELSSIGSPPQNNPFDEIKVAPRNPNLAPSAFGEGVVGRPSATSAQPAVASNTFTHNPNASTSTSTAIAANGAAPPKAKKPRKPREPKVEGKDDKPKEKKPRKPREPKVKNEDGSAPAPRKRQKKEDKVASAPDAAAGPRQSTLTEMVTQFHPPGQPASASHPQHILPSNAPPLSNTPSDMMMRDSLAPPVSKAPTPRPISSGQNYDPIRSSIMDAAPPSHPPVTVNGTQSAHTHRASASPSITSLIDPPQHANTANLPLSHTPQTTMQRAQVPPTTGFVGSTQHSPTPPRAAPVTVPSQPALVQHTSHQSPQPKPVSAMDGAMDLDKPSHEPQTRKLSQELKPQQSKASSSAPTPKEQPKEKKTASPRAAGTGLLASSNLFGGPTAKQDNAGRGVNIDIQITLNRMGGNTINIAQEIAKKYGRDAINPRATAHRQRLLQVAAAANQLEGASADDMSVDLMSDGEGDSNVEMGGMDEDKSAADEKPRKRRKKVEEYDKEDDFIDDTELAWEEQAAVAKDGFFVYSGPLVPVGTDAKVESSAPARARGSGRGRGRGRGTNAAGATTSTSTTAAAAKAKDPNAPTRGRGSRGGRTTAAPRKPRVTKADREAMEAEKAERERMAGGPPPVGGTPMHMAASLNTSAATPAKFAAGTGGNTLQMDQQQIMTSAGPVYANGTTAASGVPA